MSKSLSHSHIAATWLLMIILGLVFVSIGIARAQTVAQHRAYELGSRLKP